MIQVGTTQKIELKTGQQDFQDYANLKIQPFFRAKHFYKLNHKQINEWIKQNNIDPISLHYPTITDRFIENLEFLSRIYQQKLFTLHPFGKNPEEFLMFLARNQNKIKDLEVQLSLENLPLKKEWCRNLGLVEQIIRELPFTSLTYDTTHLPEEVDTIQRIKDRLDITTIIHLSNVKYGRKRKDHLEMQQGDRKLESFLYFLKQNNYKGQIILEYRNQNPEFLRQEIQKIESILS